VDVRDSTAIAWGSLAARLLQSASPRAEARELGKVGSFVDAESLVGAAPGLIPVCAECAWPGSGKEIDENHTVMLNFNKKRFSCRARAHKLSH
jgi:hypothetical protein